MALFSEPSSGQRVNMNVNGFVLSAKKRFCGNVGTDVSRRFAHLQAPLSLRNERALGIEHWPITRHSNCSRWSLGQPKRCAYLAALVCGVMLQDKHMRKKGSKFGIGATGVTLGALCIAFIFAIEVYGPGSYTTTGSGALYADGTIIREITRPLLPQIARAAFYACFICILFGIASFIRREAFFVSLGAVAFGIAPVLMYALGIIFTFSWYFGLALLIAGIGLYRRKHNKQKQADA